MSKKYELIFPFLKVLPDEMFIKLIYYINFNKFPDLKNPKTFNEKLQYLKLHDRKQIYTKLVDKYEVKQIVADKIGKEHIIPTIGVYDKFDDIDFSLLPNQFVMKCTHDSASTIICTNKDEFDIENARKLMNKCLKRNYYWQGREWPYKNVKPRIIIEEYLGDVNDYKFFCFGGVAKCFKVDYDRFVNHHADYFDINAKPINLEEISFKSSGKSLNISKDTLDKLKSFAEELSKGNDFLRVDLYNKDEKIYFGELTFYPAGGFGRFNDDKFDELLGKWIPLDGGVPVNPKRFDYAFISKGAYAY